MAGSVVVTDTGRVWGQYERSSSQGSINYQSDIIDDTVASRHTTNSCTTILTGEATGVRSLSSYEQNQLSSCVELAPNGNGFQEHLILLMGYEINRHLLTKCLIS